MIKKIPKIAVYLALFLIPLFSLPFTTNTLDFQKQFLLFIIVSVGVFFWMWNVLNERRLDINFSPLNLFVAAFGAVILVSSIFSLYSYGSFWGAPLPVAESFITILSLIFLYLLIINNFRKDDSYKLIAVLVVSAAVAALYGILQSMGVYLAPFFAYAKDPFFNTIGTTNSLSIYSAIVLALIFPLLFAAKNSYRVLMAICGVVLLIAVIFFNVVATIYLPTRMVGMGYDLSLVPWIVLAVGALAAFVFSVSDHSFFSKNPRIKGASFAVMFVALLFLVFNIFAKEMVLGVYRSSLGVLNAQIAPEVALDQRAAADIALDVLKQSSQSFFLGSGPGTFVYDFVKYKPEKLSQDDLGWNITFFTGASEIINRVATTGLLGVIALLLIVAMWTAEIFRALTDEKQDKILPLAIFCGWLATVVAMFFYPFNLTLAMAFWIFLGFVILASEEKKLSLPLTSVRLAYAVTLVFIGLIVLELGLLVWTSKRYYAETQYLAAVNALQKNNISAAIRNLEAAANSTDRLQDNYLIGLSQIYLAQAREELSKQSSKQEEAIKAASPYIQTAVNAAMLSTNAANPNNPTNWATRGYIYRQLVGISEGFDAWAINMYQKALTLEPNNPSLWTELGQVYVLKNDLEKAKESFNKAIALRPQYIDAHYYLALIHDQQGNKQEAIKELEMIYQLLPTSDETSRDNVTKAIENLKNGKSLSQPPTNQGQQIPDNEQSTPSEQNKTGQSNSEETSQEQKTSAPTENNPAGD